MIPSLASCLTGPFHWYKEALALPGEHAACIRGCDLLDKPCAEAIMGRYAENYPGADRRAVVSLWTQWHFGLLIAPATAAILLLNRGLPLSLDEVSIALHEEGRTSAIILPGEGKRGAGAERRFSTLFDAHVEPLVEHFSETFRVSRRLLWTNAASVFEWALQQAEPLGPSPAALSDGRAQLDRRTDGKGRPNPMAGTILHREHEGQLLRQRKVCCLRYLLPGFEDCGSLCPLPERRR